MDNNKLAVATYNKIAHIYTNKYFDDLTDSPYLDRLLSMLPDKAEILDVGCGPGQFTKYVFERGYNVQGIDLSEEMLALARKKVPSAKFSLMDMRKLKLKPDSFDALLVAYSLIHIPTKNLVNTFNGFYKILKKDGYILLITQKGLPDKITDEPLMKGEKTFVNFFTIEKINNYCKKVGFETIYQKETRSADSGSMSDNIIYTIVKKQ